MSSVKQFLESCKLEAYYDKFIEEGYDEIDDILGLDMDTLVDDIGMKKGHAKRFMKNAKTDTDEGNRSPGVTQPGAVTDDEKYNNPLQVYYQKYPERRNWIGIKYAKCHRNPRDTSCLSGNGRQHKVIMVIGETGTGKTTLLNSMTNYLFDVRYGDKFRFKLINEDQIKAQRKGKHGSMTDDVTSYFLQPTNPNVTYDLTVIDTPGFGDTRGLDKDQEIVNKIKKFFETKMNTVTGICLAVKASNTRLTAAQKYIFSTLLGLFGKDIAENIFVLVTFCDAKKPPCIGALKATKTPYKQLFKLNNSAFFLEEDTKDDSGDEADDDDADFNEMMWNMGIKSFEKFFAVIARTQDKGLGMTKQVLENRERLLVSIENLHDKIKLGTAKISELQSTKFALEQLKDRMNANKGFEITVTVEEEYKKDLPANTYTTLCMNCHYTCHRRCGIKDDTKKAGCWAMTNGYCRQCTNKCIWSDHANRPYTWERRPVSKTKTDKNIYQKYGKAKKGMSQATHVLTEIEKEIFNVKVDVLDLIKSVSKANDKLKKYALRHNPIDQKEYIELMIKSEKNDLKLGWQKRVQSLENLKGMLVTLQSIDTKDYDKALSQITLFSGSSSIKVNKKDKSSYMDKLRNKAHEWGINI